ncbi:MAG: transcription antitermination factor NusB [Rhodospirillales bacterium]|nr:transcription antitermination factor NusB [Rhodospirillales bacterium]
MSEQENQSTPRRRSASRLLAVQALYELEVSKAPMDDILLEFLQKRWETQAGESDDPITPPDKGLFLKIVRGVDEKREAITEMVDNALVDGWVSSRLELVLKNILFAGSFELLELRDIPPKVIISEYMDVAKAFFEGNEPKKVNGVLDKLAHVLRDGELNEG